MIPSDRLDEFAETSAATSASAVITAHHGKRRFIWNEDKGFQDEGWFSMNTQTRACLQEFWTASETLRPRVLQAHQGMGKRRLRRRM